MELLEIRNNLIKLAYTEEEKPTLGHFIALTSEDKSYVAQYVNIKSDRVNNFAVARLLFTFTSDGIVNDFDGSTPSINCKLVQLPIKELLDLLPVETPVQIGKISGTDEILNIDISVFEHNFTVFCENDYEKSTLISNCVRQLFRMKEKSVIIDNESFFEDYPCIMLGRDFKLPLNQDFINFVYNNELSNIDAPTKAVIQDVFYAVEQYIQTLDDKFIPIENFIDVVTAQYKETQMPELALLKNKLLKYRDAEIFANTAEEYKALEEIITGHNCVVINVKAVAPELQKELIIYIHKLLELSDKYVYYFVPLTDENSDKKLIKRLINHNHVFTTMLASHLYKYEAELKSHAQNLVFFTPQTMQHDFAAYNTFLNKLNPTEGVIYGALTQNIPFITDLYDLELDLTKEDVFGDRERFVPAIEEEENPEDENMNYASAYSQNPEPETPEEEIPQNENTQQQEEVSEIPEQSYENSEVADNSNNSDEYNQEIPVSSEPEEAAVSESDDKIENLLAPDYDEEVPEAQETQEPVQESLNTEEISQTPQETDEDLNFMEDLAINEEDAESFQEENSGSELPDELTEEDLDYIEENTSEEPSPNEEEQVPMVPVFDTEDNANQTQNSDENIGFEKGDRVSHPRYGNGVVEKIIKYGNKTLCSINFENVGRRLLDPSVTEFEKI